MKKFFSYIWPTTRRFPSKINGTLEITYMNGKKVLDTENANYSYGSLQKILEIGLTKVELNAVENILLLGMGGGSVIHSLRNTFEYTKNIVA
ncbi:MAG: spermine synthase, partial [Aequorivita sp.]|nr:spermine synthase [Aequorivita sp.]